MDHVKPAPCKFNELLATRLAMQGDGSFEGGCLQIEWIIFKRLLAIRGDGRCEAGCLQI